MLSKIKMWQILVGILCAIFIFRLTFIFKIYALMIYMLMKCFTTGNNYFALVESDIIDHFISVVCIVIFIGVLILSKKLKKIFNANIHIASITLSVIIIVSIFAPLITTQNPEFQKDISVTKLLPPFSVVQYVELNEGNDQSDDNFVLKNKIKDIIPGSFNNTVVFFDSCRIADKFYFYQSGMQNQIELIRLKNEAGQPEIKSKMYLLGSDEYGRDVFSRTIYGSRISLLVGFFAVIISLFLGLTLAFWAAEKGGIVNLILSRLTDLFLTLPSIFLVILILALFGNNLISIIVVLGFSGWMSLFKVAKSEISSIKTKEYYLSAKLLGINNFNLLTKEILPVILIPVLVSLVFQFSNVILAESALSFLGLGTGNNYPSWGSMIESGQRYISMSWWLIVIPGFVLVITLLSINDIGRRINKKINPTFN